MELATFDWDHADTRADIADHRASTKAELRAAIDPLATKTDLDAAVASVRAEPGTIR